MPRVAKELTALEVKRLKHPATTKGNILHMVGGVSGLGLQITPNGARSWLLRTTIAGKRRELGLGPYPEVGLADAREAARHAKAKVRQGIDPIAEKRKLRQEATAEARMNATFWEVFTDLYNNTVRIELKSADTLTNWWTTMETYVKPFIGNKQVQDVTKHDVLDVLKPIWNTKHKTAKTIRGRINRVFERAIANDLLIGNNPAAWGEFLKSNLTVSKKASTPVHRPALPHARATEWYKLVRQNEGLPAAAVAFTALTALRSGEVRNALWSNLDLNTEVLTIPADKMKMGREHRVPLSNAATALLESLPRLDGVDLIFPSVRGGVMKSDYLSLVMKKVCEGQFIDDQLGLTATLHGLRSTFRDFCADNNYPREVAEQALAHQVGNTVERAYNRSDVLEQRRILMEAWGQHLEGRAATELNVVELKRG